MKRCKATRFFFNFKDPREEKWHLAAWNTQGHILAGTRGRGGVWGIAPGVPQLGAGLQGMGRPRLLQAGQHTDSEGLCATQTPLQKSQRVVLVLIISAIRHCKPWARGTSRVHPYLAAGDCMSSRAAFITVFKVNRLQTPPTECIPSQPCHPVFVMTRHSCAALRRHQLQGPLRKVPALFCPESRARSLVTRGQVKTLQEHPDLETYS